MFICLIEENEILQMRNGDDDLRNTIQDYRQAWKRHALDGFMSSFVILLVGESLVTKEPDDLLKEICRRLMELCQFRHGVGLFHEAFYTERREESNHRCIRTLCCHMLSRAAEGPAPSGKTDNHHRHGADDCTPHPWFNPLRYSHELLLCGRRDILSAASSLA